MTSSATIGRIRKEARLISGEDMTHPFKKFNTMQFKEKSTEVSDYCSEFISNIGMANCSGRTVTNCTCIKDLSSEVELAYSAEKCLLAHGGRNNEMQKDFFLEWERGAMGRMHVHDRKKNSTTRKMQFKGINKLRLRLYNLSGVTQSDACTPYALCRNGFMKFFGIGSSKMVSIEKHVKDGGLTPNPHGLSNMQGNRALNDETIASLNSYFDTLKSEAEPHASKVVRLMTGLVLKEDDDNIELPSSYTKRKLYT